MVSLKLCYWNDKKTIKQESNSDKWIAMSGE
jgi:hypothetical protein